MVTAAGQQNKMVEAIKSGDIEKIVPLFLPKGAEEYEDIVTVALKTIVRCIDRHAYPLNGALVNKVDLVKPVSQELAGGDGWKVGFSDGKGGLCSLASGFAKEEFTVVDEDVQDAVGELLNCISGLFATAQSNKGITLELMPPEMGDDVSVSGSDILIMPFGIGDTTVNFVVTNKKGWR